MRNFRVQPPRCRALREEENPLPQGPQRQQFSLDYKSQNATCLTQPRTAEVAVLEIPLAGGIRWEAPGHGKQVGGGD